MSTRIRRPASVVAAAALVVVAASPTAAAARIGHYAFYDCNTTPSAFVAVRENLPDTASHGSSAAVSFRIEGGGVFVVLEFGDTPIANGIDASKLPVTCSIDFDFGTTTFSGFITGG